MPAFVLRQTMLLLRASKGSGIHAPGLLHRFACSSSSPVSHIPVSEMWSQRCQDRSRRLTHAFRSVMIDVSIFDQSNRFADVAENKQRLAAAFLVVRIRVAFERAADAVCSQNTACAFAAGLGCKFDEGVLHVFHL